MVGGMPDQDQLISSKAIFTPSYAIVPRSVLTDIVVSYFPGWRSTRAWILARPLSGFAETFAQYLMEVEPGGGCETAEPDPRAEAALFVTSGHIVVETLGVRHELHTGSFAFIPAGQAWKIENTSATISTFQWIRKVFERAGGMEPPPAIFTHEDAVASVTMPGEPMWGSIRFIDPADLRYDMHVNIVWFEGGASIPFLETHVMEHGLYVLEGKGIYRLNNDWVEVEPGDFLWLRAFCPQSCYARGSGRFKYLLYKDVNRHPKLW